MILNHSNKKMIVLAPHADDEVLGAGGLIARAIMEDWEVIVGFAVISGFESKFDSSNSQTSHRETEAVNALEILGVTQYQTLFKGETHHLRLDTIPKQDIIQFIEKMIKDHNPGVVVMPCRGHHHQDHQVFSDAAISALRPMPAGATPFVPAVLAYTHSCAGWGGENFAVRPSAFVDITNVMDKKLEALKAYKSQVFESPHPRSCEGVKNFHAAIGAYSGVEYAEAFECIRLAI